MKRKIKFSLIKKDLSFEDILKDAWKEKIKEKKDFSYIYKNAIGKINNYFINNIINRCELLKVGKQSIVVKKNIEINGEKRILIIANGDVRNIIDDYKLEQNFGIKTFINQCIKNEQEIKIKDASFRNRINGNHFRENKTNYSTLNNYSFNRTIDFLKSIKMSLDQDGNKLIVQLGNYIEIPFDEEKETEDIIEWIEKFVKNNYGLNYYKNEYGFIDNFSLVKGDLRKDILDYVWETIKNNPHSFKGLISWPTMESDSHNYYLVENSKDQIYDLELKKVIEKINPKIKNIKNVKLHSCNDDLGKIESATIQKCLVGEIIYNEKQYIIMEGRVLEVERNFVSRVDNLYLGIEKSNIKLTNWNYGENEKDYNIRLTHNNADLYNIDSKNINLKNNQKLEIADILVCKSNEEKSLLAVKKLHNSAAISHLESQVSNSIDYIHHNKKQVEDWILQTTNLKIDLNDYKKFVLAIATEESIDGKLPKLPFFAKLLLTRLANSQKGKIQVAWIKHNKSG